MIQTAIAFQARPLQAPDGQPMPRVVAQAALVADALERHGGATAEARQAVGGPLLDDVDLDALFAALPDVIEADRAFTEMLR